MEGKHVWIVTKENRRTKELAICGVYESYVDAAKSLELGDSDIEYTITQVEVR